MDSLGGNFTYCSSIQSSFSNLPVDSQRENVDSPNHFVPHASSCLIIRMASLASKCEVIRSDRGLIGPGFSIELVDG